MCYVVEYVLSPVSPDVQIQAVPIEETEWARHLSPDIIKDHYERRRLGEPSSLILLQCFESPKPEILHSLSEINREGTYFPPPLRWDYRRCSAYDPDGTHLQAVPDIYDEILRMTERLRSKNNRWVCDVEGGDIHVDIFETIRIVCKTVWSKMIQGNVQSSS